VAVAATAAIGALQYRPRPFVAQHITPLMSRAPDASFPSDHLAAHGAVTICVWFTSRRLGMTVGAIAFVLAFARVYVGVHYVSDVGSRGSRSSSDVA
jgi:undecaprenyl-diphosphatase